MISSLLAIALTAAPGSTVPCTPAGAIYLDPDNGNMYVCGTSWTSSGPWTLTSWTLEATTHLTGAVPIANGGTANTTATAGFDALAPTTTQGDVIYHNGTDNVRLGAGTAGQLLTTGGAGANPSWSGSWMTVTFTYYLNDVATSTSNQQMTLAQFTTSTAVSRAATNDYIVRANAHVIGAFLVTDAARTAGTATLQVRINGTGTAFCSGGVALDATNTVSDSCMVLPASGLALTSGQSIGCEVDTASWTPTSADFQCAIVLSFD